MDLSHFIKQNCPLDVCSCGAKLNSASIPMLGWNLSVGSENPSSRQMPALVSGEKGTLLSSTKKRGLILYISLR